jgi:ATP-dependent 26S proteasome regulatory subunit
LPDHTTLLVTGGQIGLLSEYMSLARLLQPSLVVIEDVDLIAESREAQVLPFQPVLLNSLLNEMDGLRADADVLFILTTNRPESLERALASRPGRIDQAIEFPVPDAEGRRRLLRLYGGALELPADLEETVVRRTEGVSAAFLKELMRRTAQFLVERDGGAVASGEDVDAAISEMVFDGGSLNRTLLGAGDLTADPERAPADPS